MKTFDYIVIPTANMSANAIANSLDQAGSQGYRFVGTVGTIAIMERES